MTNMQIDIIRDTDAVTDAQVARWVAAIQTAAIAHFTSAWGIELDLQFVLPGHPTRGCAQAWIKDRSPEAGDLGYHEDLGVPMGYVFALDDRDSGCDTCVTLSHEIWELAIDPSCQAVRTWVDGAVTNEVGLEVADAVEDDSLAFLIDGCKISAFVTPAYFVVRSPGPWSYPPTAIDGPFKIAPGGYLPLRQVTPVPGPWTQVAAMEPSPRQIKGPLSRTARRFTGTKLAAAEA